jgi:hypothetical protein
MMHTWTIYVFFAGTIFLGWKFNWRVLAQMEINKINPLKFSLIKRHLSKSNSMGSASGK